MNWLGWLREDRFDEWECVSEGQTCDEAAGKLHEEAQRRGVKDNLCCYLTRGDTPPREWLRPERKRRAK